MRNLQLGQGGYVMGFSRLFELRQADWPSIHLLRTACCTAYCIDRQPSALLTVLDRVCVQENKRGSR